MGAKSSIEWTDATWNPVRGCSMAKGSETGGCLNCYAARLNARGLPGMVSPTTGKPFARILQSGPRWTGDVELIEKALLLPLKWRRPKRIFVNSLSDLFHEDLPDEAIDRVFAVMALCPQHTFQILTKRPERMRRYFSKERPGVVDEVFLKAAKDGGLPDSWWGSHVCFVQQDGLQGWPLPNVWLGVSIENQATADMRIPLLLQTPSTKRFVSYEPALGPVDLEYPETLYPNGAPMCCSGQDCGCLGKPTEPPLIHGIDWVIVGGESGPQARPMRPEWARTVRDQCVSANVLFFFKQWGEWMPTHVDLAPPARTAYVTPVGELIEEGDSGWSESQVMRRVGKKSAGHLLDDREWQEFPK